MGAAISSVSTCFNEYMNQYSEQNHLVYIPPPPILDLVKKRAAIAVVPSTSSSTTAPVANLEDHAPDMLARACSTPPY